MSVGFRTVIFFSFSPSIEGMLISSTLNTLMSSENGVDCGMYMYGFVPCTCFIMRLPEEERPKSRTIVAFPVTS